MPMPAPGSPWPPPETKRVGAAHREWAGWWANDTDTLARIYGRADSRPRDLPAQHRGGVIGAVARWFWGQPTPPGQRSTKLHVPAASDLAGTAADLLFASPPTLRREDAGRGAGTAAQDRLDVLFGERTMTGLHRAAEHVAALGGTFLRAGWDHDVADHPLLSEVHADAAIPRFRYDRLAEVTFHREVARDGDTVVRHLEHHAVAGGQGYVEHALFEGRPDNLGHPIPLTESPATVDLVDGLDENGLVLTGLDRLDVVYVEHAPTRRWRDDPYGAQQGRSVLDGSEPLLDALDEVYSSWMRDIRLGKGRLVVPGYYLETPGRGQGATFDEDREVFTTVNREPGGTQSGLAMTASQFAIRHAEHQATAAQLWETIVTNGARYSAQTFGLQTEVAMTASESYARERKTNGTRGGQQRYWKLALVDAAEMLQMLDVAQFDQSYEPQRPDIDWPPMFEEQPAQRAQTASLLAAADAASVETLVAMAHPEWDADQQTAEVARIRAQAPQSPGDLE